jgi:hypothetical protein
MLAGISSTVVQPLTHVRKVKGSIRAIGGTGRKKKKILISVQKFLNRC